MHQLYHCPRPCCCSINAKSDKKNKYAIALFTKDDYFSIVCDSEKERSDWLGAMQELQAEEDDSDEPRPYFGKHCIFSSLSRCCPPLGQCSNRTP